MAKKLLALALCFVLCATLIGCGVTGNSGYNAVEMGTKDIYAETDSWNGMDIRVAGYRNFQDDPLNWEFAYGAEQFAEEYGTNVTFRVGGQDGQGEDLAAAIASGDPWEVQYSFGISVFPLVFADGLYTPIDEYINYETNDKIDEITVEGAKWLGRHYGISSLPMQEMWYIAYNETWMKELGIKTPYEYYEEGKWDMDAYKEVNAAAVAKEVGFRSSISRPHTGASYISDWDDKKGKVTVTYDQPKNVEWLNFWGELLTNPQYDIRKGGRVSQRQSLMRDEVMPNLIKDEISQTTSDVIRYIHFPRPEGGLGTYLTDSHFLFPAGVAEEKLPCAIALASYMTDAKSKVVVEDTYKAYMTEEDWALFEENMNHAYFLPRIFYYGVFQIGSTFLQDMNAGKAVATHIAENTESLKAKADEFNAKYSVQ